MWNGPSVCAPTMLLWEGCRVDKFGVYYKPVVVRKAQICAQFTVSSRQRVSLSFQGILQNPDERTFSKNLPPLQRTLVPCRRISTLPSPRRLENDAGISGHRSIGIFFRFGFSGRAATSASSAIGKLPPQQNQLLTFRSRREDVTW